MRRFLVVVLLAGSLSMLGTAGAQTEVPVTCAPGLVPIPPGQVGGPGCGVDLSNDVIIVDPATGQPVPRPATSGRPVESGCRSTGTTVPGGATIYLCVDPTAAPPAAPRPAPPAQPRPAPRVALTG